MARNHNIKQRATQTIELKSALAPPRPAPVDTQESVIPLITNGSDELKIEVGKIGCVGILLGYGLGTIVTIVLVCLIAFL